MKVWITTYALSADILVAEVDQPRESTPNTILVKFLYFHKPHWHETEKEALAHADAMRAKRVESLRKQIDALNAMEFTFKEFP